MALTLLINVDVDDLTAATAFYCNAFELQVGRRFGPFGIELLGANAPLYLLVKQAGSIAAAGSLDGGEARARAERYYQRHWTPVHLDMVVDDIDLAMERVTAAGARQESDLHTHNWGRIAHFADPFGHGFCLIQFLNGGYDEIAQAE